MSATLVLELEHRNPSWWDMSEIAEPILDPEDMPIWGAASIGVNIKKSTKATYHLLEQGALPATKVAGVWTSTPRRLRAHFAGEGK